MNHTPYTDDQILEALEQALGSLANRDMIIVRPGNKWRAYWDKEKDVRLQIGKKFLELLYKSQPDPYATLKAYAKAGARIRCGSEFDWSEWTAGGEWAWYYPPENYQVHPADLHLLDCEQHVNETDFVNIWTPKPGDVVQLKSGGPRMTVRLPQDENYLCTWTSDNGVFERFFPLACLQQA